MFLLDTNALIGYLYTNKIPVKVIDLLADADDVYVSIASLWEISIKQSIGKIEIKDSLLDISATCAELGFNILPIKPIHLDRIRTVVSNVQLFNKLKARILFASGNAAPVSQRDMAWRETSSLPANSS